MACCTPEAEWTAAVGLAILVVALMAAMKQFVLSKRVNSIAKRCDHWVHFLANLETRESMKETRRR
jgi:hypothetical protein